MTESKEFAAYFEAVAAASANNKAAANWVMVNVKSYLNERAIELAGFPLSPLRIAELIKLIDSGKISHSVASQKVFPAMAASPGEEVLAVAERLNVIQNSDTGFLEDIIRQALAKYPDKVAEYKSGKQSLVGLFMGEVMKLSQGKADPKLANQLLRDMLDNA